MRRFIVQRNEGQAVVLAALAFIVLVGALGLALDGANAYNQRRNVNNAADAAAMAGTRALLDANENGGTNRDVFLAVKTYVETHLSTANGNTLTWHAYYIDRNGNQVSSEILNNTNAVQVVDMSNSANVRGISVDIQYGFKTFFMPLLGRNNLAASGYGLGLVGPLGGATGPALIPLAISDTAAANWQGASASDKALNWSMGVYTSTAGLGSRTIDQTDLRMIALDTSGAVPAYGGGGDCSSGTPQNTLIYWWCKGTAYNIETTPDEIDSRSMPPSNSMRNTIRTNRILDDVLMPVYNLTDFSTGKVKIVGFLAVHLTSFQNTGPNSGILKGKIIDYYLAPGPISGESSGFFDTYAINLVR